MLNSGSRFGVKDRSVIKAAFDRQDRAREFTLVTSDEYHTNDPEKYLYAGSYSMRRVM